MSNLNPFLVPARLRARRAMPRAIILSAGRGKRLLPLTAQQPKCLIPVGGASILEWQSRALAAAGIESGAVVAGFGAEHVASVLAARCPVPPQLRIVYNPDFDRSDNLISAWMARSEMQDDFLLINGDTLFEPAVISRLLASPPAPVTVAVNHKASYDDDDMKVALSGHRLERIGKDLPLAATDAEAIGVLLVRGGGVPLFRETLERLAVTQGATRRYYLSVVSELAAQGLVSSVSVTGLRSAEIDFLADLPAAERLVARWRELEERRYPVSQVA